MLKQCKNHVWRLLATKMQLRWRLPSGLEVFVKSYADWCMYNEIFVNGEYTTAVRKLLQDGGKAPVRVFDLGANLGFFAIYLVNAFALSNRAADLRLCLVEGAPRIGCQRKYRHLPTRGCGDRPVKIYENRTINHENQGGLKISTPYAVMRGPEKRVGGEEAGFRGWKKHEEPRLRAIFRNQRGKSR